MLPGIAIVVIMVPFPVCRWYGTSAMPSLPDNRLLPGSQPDSPSSECNRQSTASRCDTAAVFAINRDPFAGEHT